MMNPVNQTSQLIAEAMGVKPVWVREIFERHKGDLSCKIERYVCRMPQAEISALLTPILICHLGGRKVSIKKASSLTSIPSMTTLAPAGLDTAWRMQGVLDFALVYLRGQALDQLNQLSSHLSVPTTIKSPLCCLLIREIVELCGDENRVVDHEQLQALGSALMWQFRDEFQQSAHLSDAVYNPGHISYVQDALAYIHGNLDKPLRCEDIAAVVSLNSSYFRKIFHKVVGSSLHRYVIDKRLEAARELIVNTGVGFSEIADETGFGSQSYMATSFRKYLDVTPQNLRCMHRS